MPQSSRFSFPFQSSSYLHAPLASTPTGLHLAPPLLPAAFPPPRLLPAHSGLLPFPLPPLAPHAHDALFAPRLPPAPPAPGSAFSEAAGSPYLPAYVTPGGRGFAALGPSLPLCGLFPWGGAVSGAVSAAQAVEDSAWRELHQMALQVLDDTLRWLCTVPAFVALSSLQRQRLLARGGCAMLLWGFHVHRRLGSLSEYCWWRHLTGEGEGGG